MARTKAQTVEQANRKIREAYQELRDANVLTAEHPVGRVQWVPASKVKANDYNPNSVSHHEMNLLHTSVSEDGYTQPVVTIYDSDQDRYIVIDGFHRYLAVSSYEDLNEATGGYLPVVILEKSLADRMASTIRHNRARGKHSVQGMGNLVFQMLEEGQAKEEICNKLGLEPEEFVRLTHVTGYSKLYGDVEYNTVELNETQMRAKQQHQEEFPDEYVPRV